MSCRLLSPRALRLVSAAAAAAALALSPTAFAQETPAAPERVRLGEGEWQFEWVPGWAKLPEGMTFGSTHGCIVVDAKDRVYVNTDTEHAVIVLEADGTFVKSFGKELAGGAHGMCLAKEADGREVIYLTHLKRHELLKVTLDGEILWSVGYPELAGIYQDRNQYNPTSVAVGPNGHLYVADGYGLSWVHELDAEGKWVRSFGGPGTEPGKMQTPHGIWLDTRASEPRLVVADRANHRLQWFDLEGELLGVLDQDLRFPCHAQQHGTMLVVADLHGRITLVDGEDRVVAHLGDNPDPALRGQYGVPADRWRDGEFLSPHCAAWDSKGNLYVMDWNHLGRVNKLERVR